MDKITIAATNWAKMFAKNNTNKIKNLVEESYKEGFIKGANLQKEANLHKIKSLEEEIEQNKKCFERLTDSLIKEKSTDSLNKEKENKEPENSLSEGRIQELLKEEKILNALRDYGVDNWEGYEMAMDSVEEE